MTADSGSISPSEIGIGGEQSGNREDCLVESPAADGGKIIPGEGCSSPPFPVTGLFQGYGAKRDIKTEKRGDQYVGRDAQ